MHKANPDICQIDSEGYTFIECHWPECPFVCKTKWDFGIHLSYHLAKQNELDSLGPQDHPFIRVGPKWSGNKVLKPYQFKARTSGANSKAPLHANLTENDPAKGLTEVIVPELQCELCGLAMTNKDPKLQLQLHIQACFFP